MRKALIIYNPTAGIRPLVSSERRQIVRQLQQCGYESRVIELTPLFERQVAESDLADLALVVAVGGDGTVKVAARTMYLNHITAPLLIIRRGSANIVASALRLPFGLRRSFRLLERGIRTRIDLGVINDQEYFVVGFSAGYISQIVTSTPPTIKNKIGFFAYVLKLLLTRGPRQQGEFVITQSGNQQRLTGNSLVVFNTVNLYGLAPRKRISVSDGLLNLYVVANRNIFQLIGLAFDFLRYEAPPRHVAMLDASEFQISLPYDTMCPQVDGDPIVVGQELAIRVIPQAIEVVVDKSLKS